MSDTSFDMAALSAKHSEPESKKRLSRRHWAEFRLRAYGVLAILLAAAALVVLVYTIASKTLTVTNEYYLSLDVKLEASKKHMTTLTDGNPKTLVDLKKPLRNALRAAAETGLKGRKARPLYALVSKFEGYELASVLEADPSLLGQNHSFEALLDDSVQLYLKGDYGTLQDAGSTGDLTLAADGDDDVINLQISMGALANARVAVQQDRAQEARVLRRSALDQERAFQETQVLFNAESDATEQERLKLLMDGFAAERDKGFAQADFAEAEANDPKITLRLDEDDPSVFLRVNQGWLKVVELGPTQLSARVMDAPKSLDAAAEGDWTAYFMRTPENVRQIDDRQALWLENFKRQDLLVSHFNKRVLLSSDSSNAELAGIWGALVGSFWTMIVTFALVFPIGVMASIYLEEFAPKNRVTDFIEVNINNLAAVPSIVFGLLGLTILLSGVKLFGVDLFDGLLKAFAEDPRSTPLAGGVVLALMSLPTIIIAARASIKAVPPSIRDAALGLGASRLQTSTHHVLPLAMPGILTGSIIAMAQALGETAPLIIIGMNSFIQDPPGGPMDKANVLPSLIYLWNNNSERLFDGKTAVAISVLLVFLVLMNALAVVLRKRFERRW